MSRLEPRDNIISANLPTIFIDSISIRSDVPGQINSGVLRDGLELTLSIEISSADGTEPEYYYDLYSSLYGYATFIFQNSLLDEIRYGSEFIYNHMKSYLSWFYPGTNSSTLNDAVFAGPIITTTEYSDTSVEEPTYEFEIGENSYTITTQEEDLITTSVRTGAFLRRNYIKFNLSSFFEADESGVMYSSVFDDEVDGKIYRYSTTIELPFELIYTTMTFVEYYQLIKNIDDEDYSNLHVCTFSSILDFDEETEDDASPLFNNLLAAPYYSNICYELVLDNVGTAATGPYTNYTLPNLSVYDGIPLQLPIGTFHQADYPERMLTRDTLTNIVNNFTPDSVETQESIDGFKQIIAEQFSETSLLLSLNQFKLAYPDKSTAFYGLIEAAIETEILRYQSQPRVQPNMFYNPKIVDARSAAADEETAASSGYEFPEVEPNTADATAGEISSDRIYDNPRITRYAYHKEYYGMDHTVIWEASDTLFTTGYIFADIEKIIRNDIELASIIDIDKLELLFGQEITSKAIKIDSHYLTRFYDGDAQFYILTRYADSDEEAGGENDTINAASPMEITPIATVSTSLQGSPVYYEIDVGVDGVPDNTYCLLRNFEVATDNRSGYRLACFQFQDYYDILLADESDAIDESLEHYTFYLTCEDKSLEVLYALRDSYQAELSKFEEYYNLANEYCSYNNIKGYFNQFFVDGMNELYGADLNEAPFRRAPLIFNMHQDLLYNFFDGDVDEIVASSRVTEMLISPSDGTMEQITALYEAMTSLYSTYWDVDGVIGQQITAAESGGFDLSYYNEFKDLPTIIDMGESYENYLEDLATGAAEAAASAAESLEYYTNLYETNITLYNTNLKKYVDEKIQEYDDYGWGNKKEKADIIRDIKKYIGEIKDNAEEDANTINGLLETAGHTTSTGDYNHFPTYTSAFKDVYAANTTAALIAYNAILDKDSDIEDEAESSEATSEIGEPHDLNALRLFRYGF